MFERLVGRSALRNGQSFGNNIEPYEQNRASPIDFTIGFLGLTPL